MPRRASRSANAGVFCFFPAIRALREPSITPRIPRHEERSAVDGRPGDVPDFFGPLRHRQAAYLEIETGVADLPSSRAIAARLGRDARESFPRKKFLWRRPGGDAPP